MKKCEHKRIVRFKTYEPGDVYAYHKRCIDCKTSLDQYDPLESYFECQKCGRIYKKR